MKSIHIPFAAAALAIAAQAGAAEHVDILVVGGGCSVVAAAVQAARMGCSTRLVEELPWIGGMLTAAGVSATDGNYSLRSGFWGEFVDSLTAVYGSSQALRTGWVSNIMFDPGEAHRILTAITAAEPRLTVSRNTALQSLAHNNGRRGWTATLSHDGKTEQIEADIVIDATELADVAAMVGIPYDLGMESRHQTGEDIAPEKANGIVQDMTYVAILEAHDHPVAMDRPDGYDPAEFACCSRNAHCTNPTEPERMWRPDQMLTYGRLPGRRYMINWPIEGNDYYAPMADATPADREAAIHRAKQRTLRFVYFMHHELGMDTLAIADGLYPSADGLPLMPYHREGRRIHGLARVTLPYIEHPYDYPEPLYRTTIAVGDYPVDQHHSRYDGAESLPDLHFHPIPSWGLPAAALVPAGTPDFIVAEKGISVSNIVNGTTRLQPVTLQTGQAAGAMAALCCKEGYSPEATDIRALQGALLEAGAYLLPFADIATTDAAFKPLQRIGACGLLQGEGRSEGWTNITRIYPDSAMTLAEARRLPEYYGIKADLPGDGLLTRGDLQKIAGAIAPAAKVPGDPDAILTRAEYACLTDSLLDPFQLPIDLFGRQITPCNTKKL